MSPKKDTGKSAKKLKGFTDEERVAMKERVRELKADKADGESAVLAKTLVRDAGVCQGRQRRLLLPKRAEVQDEVRDVRLQRQGEPRRRRHVADRLRSDGVDRRRRGKDRRAREESGNLRERHSSSSRFADVLTEAHARSEYVMNQKESLTTIGQPV